MQSLVIHIYGVLVTATLASTMKKILPYGYVREVKKIYMFSLK